MNVQERIAKLEALLARVTTRATEPRQAAVAGVAHAGGPAEDDFVDVASSASPSRAANGPASAPLSRPVAPPPHVVAAAPIVTREVPELPEEETEEVELDAVELGSLPPAGPPAEDPTESRERMVAAPAVDEHTDVANLPPVHKRDRDSDGPTVMRTSPREDDAPELEVAEAAEIDGDAEELPPSSRRPIHAEAPEPPLAELAFGDAPAPPMPHTPPPESGRQVSATPADLDFESEATGVRSKPDESLVKAPSAPPAAHASTDAPVTVKSVPPPAKTVPPAAVKSVPPPVKLAPQVVRPSLDAADGVASFVGKPVEFKPATFGDLLDASLDL